MVTATNGDKELIKIAFDRGAYEIGCTLKAFEGGQTQVLNGLILFFERFYDLESQVYAYMGETVIDEQDLPKEEIGHLKNCMRKVELLLSQGDLQALESLIRFELLPGFMAWRTACFKQFKIDCDEKAEGADLWFNAPITLVLNATQSEVNLCVDIDGLVTEHRTPIKDCSPSEYNYLFYWMIDALKEVFLRMPSSDLSFDQNYSVEIQTNRASSNFFGNLTGQMIDILSKTNQFLGDFSHLKKMLSANRRALFYIFESEEHYRMGEFIKYWDQKFPGESLVKTFPSGWDKHKRAWVETGYRFNMTAFMKDLIEGHVYKVVGLNHYTFDNALSHESLYMPAIMNYLGVQLLQVCFDPVEYEPFGQLRRKCYTLENVTRYSVLPILSREWDELYQQERIFYTPIVQHYSADKSKSYLDLADDYNIVVMSQSRIGNVKENLEKILFVLDHMDSKNIFKGYQMWFLAMRKLLLEKENISQREQMTYGLKLHELMYTIANFLKFEVIDSIRTDRAIEIYGDLGWQIVFPQYFQNKYLNAEEIGALDKANKHLHLLFHNSFNYLETGGPVYDAIANGRPFINYSALARDPKFEGFSCVEYENAKDINQLINQYKTISTAPKLAEAIENYNEIMYQAETAIAENIFKNKAFSMGEGEYYTECKAHYELLSPEIDRFIEDHMTFLRQCDAYLFGNAQMDYKIEQSLYYDKPFVKNINNMQFKGA